MNRLITWVIVVAFALPVAVFTRPVPDCVSPYGVRDDTVCVYAGYPYDHGIQVG